MRWIKSCLVLLLFAAASLSLSAQDGSPGILIIDYMKSAPGQASAYVDMELEVWADIHRQRLADGVINGWYLYDVRFSGTASEYDYVTITTVSNWDAVDVMFSSGNMEKYMENLSAEQQAIAGKTDTYRNLVRTDVLVTSSFLNGDNFDADNFPRYAWVNFMDVPEDGMDAYMNMEINLARPMHEAIMKAGGGVASWGMYSVTMPAGAHRPYDFVTVDFFNKWSDMGAGNYDYEDLFQEVHPNMTIEFYEDQIANTRTMTRRECWVLIERLAGE